MTKDELIKKNQELIKENEELVKKLNRCEQELVRACNNIKILRQKMIDMNVKFYGTKAKIL